MTPPPEPRTAAVTVRIHADIAAILKPDEVLTEFKRLARRLWGSGVKVEAEAAGSPKGLSSAPLSNDSSLREALDNIVGLVNALRRNGYNGYQSQIGFIEDQALQALTATPARCLRPCMNSGCRCPYRSPRCDACQRGDHNRTATPAPEPFYDSDGIPIPDELYAGLEPVSPERSDPTLLWHGDGDECTGIHCGNPEHGWTEPAPAYVECPSCDDASAAHIAGLHEEPAPDRAASLTARVRTDVLNSSGTE